MAGYKYFTVLTDVGKQKLAEAIANETALDFTEMAVGDSNGTSYEPTSDMTALKHVTYRAAIGSMKINAEDKNIMEFEFVVPASTGGFYVREAGLYSSDGTLIAISRLPEQYKADMAEGAGSSMTVRILVAISSDAQIYITVPASITYATQTYVIEEFKKHKADSNPHEQYVLNEIYFAKIDELQEDINSKAANTHNHDSTYLKKTDASSTYATKEALNTGLAGKAATNHSHSNYAANNHNHDSVYSKTNHTHSNYLSKNPASIELMPSSSANNGGSLDFHYNGNSTDYTSRIIETARGKMSIYANNGLLLNSKPIRSIAKYTNSTGIWEETLLETGEIMLEGYGEATTGSIYGDVGIYYPKKMKGVNNFISVIPVTNIDANLSERVNNSGVDNIGVVLLKDGNYFKNCLVKWYVKGILA